MTCRKLTENKVYLGVMEAFQPHFEPRLRPMLSPANPRGGFGSSGRLQFTPSEDVLLALGVCVSLGDQSRVLLGDDYDRIRKELLPGKESAQLRNRSKNQRNGKSNRMNVHRRYFALYSEFRKWDDSVYKKICQLIMTHRRRFTGVRGSDELASAAAIVLLLLQRDVAALLLAEPVLLRGEVASRGHAAVPHHACEHGEQGGDGDAG